MFHLIRETSGNISFYTISNINYGCQTYGWRAKVRPTEVPIRLHMNIVIFKIKVAVIDNFCLKTATFVIPQTLKYNISSECKTKM